MDAMYVPVDDFESLSFTGVVVYLMEQDANVNTLENLFGSAKNKHIRLIVALKETNSCTYIAREVGDDLSGLCNLAIPYKLARIDVDAAKTA